MKRAFVTANAAGGRDSGRTAVMRRLNMLGLVAGLLAGSGPRAELVITQEAIEAHDVTIMVQGEGTGYVLARGCANCPYLRLDIDVRTAITVAGRTVVLGSDLGKRWPGGIVIYDTGTGHIVRLKL